MARPARARLRQHRRSDRLDAVVGSSRGCAPDDLGARAILARARARHRGSSLARAWGSRWRQTHRPISAPTLSGPPPVWPQGRATGTLPSPCSRRRRRCSALRNAAARWSSLSPSSASSIFVATTPSGRQSCATRLSRSRATSEIPARRRRVLSILSDVARTRGEHARALAFSEEALELRRVLDDPLLITDSTYHVGVAAFGSGDLDRSEAAFEDALLLARDRRGCDVHGGGALHARYDRAPEGRSLAGSGSPATRAWRSTTDLADDRSRAECLCALGGYAAATGHPEEAARLWGAADAARGHESPRVRRACHRGAVHADARRVAGCRATRRAPRGGPALGTRSSRACARGCCVTKRGVGLPPLQRREIG